MYQCPSPMWKKKIMQGQLNLQEVLEWGIRYMVAEDQGKAIAGQGAQEAARDTEPLDRSRRSPRPRTAKDADGPTREDTARRWATSATPVGKPAILCRYAGPRDQVPADDKDEDEAKRGEEDAGAIPGEGPPTETMGRRRRRKRRSYGSR